MTGQPLRGVEVRIEMTLNERERYVRWWVERSGLTSHQLRQIATGIWSDRVLEGWTEADEQSSKAA
jgi:hypothetical protein